MAFGRPADRGEDQVHILLREDLKDRNPKPLREIGLDEE
jgi:hypothetical protein